MFAEATSELLCDNCVEEIFTPPDIVNPFSVSVQVNGILRDLLLEIILLEIILGFMAC